MKLIKFYVKIKLPEEHGECEPFVRYVNEQHIVSFTPNSSTYRETSVTLSTGESFLIDTSKFGFSKIDEYSFPYAKEV